MAYMGESKGRRFDCLFGLDESLENMSADCHSKPLVHVMDVLSVIENIAPPTLISAAEFPN